MAKLKEHRQAIIIGLLALIGSITGAFIGSHLETKQWAIRADFEQRRAIIEKRLELLERTTKFFGEFSKAHQLTESMDTDSKNKIKLDKMNAEFANLIMLNGLHFGDKTRDALQLRLNYENWWEFSAEDQIHVLSAMFEEVNYFPTKK